MPLFSLAVAAYRRLLKLNPERFYTVFAEEMTEVFSAALRDAQGQGQLTFLTMLAKELFSLPVSAMHQHVRHLRIAAPGEGPEIQPVAWAKVLLALYPGLLTLVPISHIFGYSREHPVVVTLTCLPPLAASLLVERRVALWALPGLGLLISQGLWFGVDYALLAAAGVLAITLIWQAFRRRRAWLLWAVFGAMLAAAIASYAVVILAPGILAGVIRGQIFPGQLMVELRRVAFPLGLALYVVVAGLPFARRFGAAAILISLSAMLWPLLAMLGIDGQSMGLGQTLEMALPWLYIAILLVILPAWMLRASSPEGRLKGILIPLLSVLIGGAGVTIWFYTGRDAQVTAEIVNRTQFVVQSLLALTLSWLLYDRVGRKNQRAASETRAGSTSNV